MTFVAEGQDGASARRADGGWCGSVTTGASREPAHSAKGERASSALDGAREVALRSGRGTTEGYAAVHPREVAKWPEWKIDRVQAAQFARVESKDRSETSERR